MHSLHEAQRRVQGQLARVAECADSAEAGFTAFERRLWTEVLALGRAVMRGLRSPRGGGQTWTTFLRNHADRMWACDFIQTYDLFFRQVNYAFFVVHLSSRRVVHVAATRHPTQAWTAQQLRNALMGEAAPAVLLRERDGRFGSVFDHVAEGAGARVIKIAVRAPNMNAIADALSGAHDARCSITFCFLTTNTSARCSGSTGPTSTRAGPIRGSTSGHRLVGQ